MSRESASLSDRPGGSAESALDAAARHLGATPSPGGRTALGGREILRRRQERDLLVWAEQGGRLIYPQAYLPLICDGSEEHRVWIPGSLTRHFKATHPGRCGFTVVCGEETEFIPAA